jgi:hypothetical protein
MPSLSRVSHKSGFGNSGSLPDLRACAASDEFLRSYLCSLTYSEPNCHRLLASIQAIIRSKSWVLNWLQLVAAATKRTWHFNRRAATFTVLPQPHPVRTASAAGGVLCLRHHKSWQLQLLSVTYCSLLTFQKRQPEPLAMHYTSAHK